MIKNKLVILFVGIIVLVGCSSKISTVDINKPTIKFFKKSIQQLKESNKMFEENSEKEIEEEIYFVDRKIQMRNKIIDSLGLTDKNNFLIIDSRTDNNGERIESSYFFYENKIIFAGFIKSDSIVNNEVFVKFVPEIKEITKQYLEKNLYDINYFNEIFNSNKIPNNLKGGSERSSYLVTVVSNKKISYYSVSGFVNYKVIKLFQKKYY